MVLASSASIPIRMPCWMSLGPSLNTRFSANRCNVFHCDAILDSIGEARRAVGRAIVLRTPVSIP